MLIGKGCYASVFDSDQPNMVIKHTKHTLSDAYVLYALYAIEFPSPMLPKISAAVLNKNGGSYFMLEKLKEGGKESKKPNICGTLDDDFLYIQNKILTSVILSSMEKLQFISLITEMNLWFRYDEERYPFFLDAHPDNWMFRDDQLVLIDPLCYNVRYESEVTNIIIDRAKLFEDKIKLIDF